MKGSFWRYPGGKAKVQQQIVLRLNLIKGDATEYREPFCGGAGIGLQFLGENPQIKTVWFNDKDVGVASIWTSVIRLPEMFKQHIKAFTPSIPAFDEFKTELLATNAMPQNDAEVALLGFKKLAIHQISYSGLGTKSGGPLGGREQKSEYKIDCRWSPDYICKKVDWLHQFFSRFEFRNGGCTSLDFTEVVSPNSPSAVIYLDPPYYVKGGELYQHAFAEEDHRRLEASLRTSGQQWVLSYDDCLPIRDLYQWAKLDTLDVKCTINGKKDPTKPKRQVLTKTELLIAKP